MGQVNHINQVSSHFACILRTPRMPCSFDSKIAPSSRHDNNRR